MTPLDCAVWVDWLVLPQVRPSGPRWERYKTLIVQRDQSRCQSCFRPVDLDPMRDGRTLKAHIDHIVPFSLGGSNDGRNLQTLCEPCNLSKGDRPVAGQSQGEWSRHVKFQRWYESLARQHSWEQTHATFVNAAFYQPVPTYSWLHRVGWVRLALEEHARNYPGGSRSYEPPPGS